VTTDGSGDIETSESSESFDPATLATGKKLDLRLRSHEKRSQGYLEDLFYSSKQDLLLASYFDHNVALFQLGVELEGSTIHRCAISNGSNVH